MIIAFTFRTSISRHATAKAVGNQLVQPYFHQGEAEKMAGVTTNIDLKISEDLPAPKVKRQPCNNPTINCTRHVPW